MLSATCAQGPEAVTLRGRKDAVTIEYSGLSEGSKLYVSDAIGVLREVQILSGAKGKMVINTGSYTNGIYVARVETEGDAPLKNKFVILK